MSKTQPLPSTHIEPSESYFCLPESEKSLARSWLPGSEGWVKHGSAVDGHGPNGGENASGLESWYRQTAERGHEVW